MLCHGRKGWLKFCWHIAKDRAKPKTSGLQQQQLDADSFPKPKLQALGATKRHCRGLGVTQAFLGRCSHLSINFLAFGASEDLEVKQTEEKCKGSRDRNSQSSCQKRCCPGNWASRTFQPYFPFHVLDFHQ